MTGAGNELVLVAGVEYPVYRLDEEQAHLRFVDGSPGPWRQLCEEVAAAWLRSPSRRVTLFDFWTGTVETRSSPGRVAASSTRELGAVSMEDYRAVGGDDETQLLPPSPELALRDARRIHYFPGVSRVGSGPISWFDYMTARRRLDVPGLSVTDVYEHVVATGSSSGAGSIAGIHFWSHGFQGGPILVNSLDLSSQDKERDRLDRDGRATKDFEPRNLDRTAFEAAFAAGARSYVWGCGTDDLLNALWRGRGPRDRLEVLELVRREVDRGYAQRLADASGRPVVAALPGTALLEVRYGEDDEDHIPRVGLLGGGVVEDGRAQELFGELPWVDVPSAEASDPLLRRGFAVFNPRLRSSTQRLRTATPPGRPRASASRTSGAPAQ